MNIMPSSLLSVVALRVLHALRVAGFAALSVATMLPSLAQAPVDLKVALVIGNAAYPGSAALANPANDAKAMGDTLRSLGFSVVEARDASRAQMSAAIGQVREQLQGKQGVGMLFYAGHGLQVDWRNYMIPIDAKIASATDVPAQAVDVADVLSAFKQAGNRMNILVLDACRDNPFASGSSKGLAQMDALPSTFLAYATAPGNVADDGAGSNGLYTSFLLQELKKPQARIEDVFKRVRLHVRQKSEGRQIPWESTSLEDDFVFNSGVQTVKQQSLNEREKAFNEEKTAWETVKSSINVNDFYAFLQRYPSGEIAELANFQVASLQKAQVKASPSKDGAVALDAGVARFRLGDVSVFDQIDGFTKQSQRITQTVTAIDGNKVIINNGAIELDLMGNVLRNRFGVKNPGILNSPADIAVGKKWRSSFTNTAEGSVPTNNFWDAHVIALEEITVPAGKMQAFRVERNGKAVGRDGVSILQGTQWIDPKTMRVIRNDILFRLNGKITENSSTQLVSTTRTLP